MPQAMIQTPRVRMEGITKTFPGVVANDGIDVDFYRGEVHALLGENGAGKTTLMNILYGLYRPDSGRILIDGRPVSVADPKTAIKLGIGMVHQHFMLVAPFTVAENIVLGAEPRGRFGTIDMKAAVAKVTELSEAFGLKVDPDAKIESISVGMQQRVEILKALYRGADVLILDEPTAVLTPMEVAELRNITDGLAAQGKTIIIITHKLKEVMTMAARVTVIRRGRNVGTFDTKSVTKQTLAKAMVGRDVVLEIPKGVSKPGETVLEVANLRVKGGRGLESVKGVSFSVRRGEIFGIAGVEGNGQSELIEALAGLRKVSSGTIKVLGKAIGRGGARAANEAGVAHIPEDRQKRGLVLDFSVAENSVLDSYYRPPYSAWAFIKPAAIDAFGRSVIAEYDVRVSSERAAAKTLSGGNQQKLVIGRELSRHPEVILAAQPTRGLDVGAIEFVHRQLLAARDAGKAVVLTSLELDEVLALSDRVAVMYEGEFAAILDASEAKEETVGLLMAGVAAGGEEGDAV